MAEPVEPHYDVDEEIDSGYPEVAKSVKAQGYDISYNLSSDRAWMLPALSMEEKEGS